MFSYALDYAIGRGTAADCEAAERAFMASRAWSDFHRECKQSALLTGLAWDWASDIFNTASFLQSGERHFKEREMHRRVRVSLFYKMWRAPRCEHSSHASIEGFSASIDDPVWDTIVPPFDYACACSVSLADSKDLVDWSGPFPQTALISHDWMSVFPSHLELKRFVVAH
jgi:hypothetical protein